MSTLSNVSHTTGAVIDELLVLRFFITPFLRGPTSFTYQFFLKRSATHFVEWGHSIELTDPVMKLIYFESQYKIIGSAIERQGNNEF